MRKKDFFNILDHLDYLIANNVKPGQATIYYNEDDDPRYHKIVTQIDADETKPGLKLITPSKKTKSKKRDNFMFTGN